MCYIQSLSLKTFRFISRERLEWLECGPLTRLPWLAHAFTSRREGSGLARFRDCTLGNTPGKSQASVERNRKRLMRALGVERLRLATLRQIHSSNIYRVTRSSREGGVEYIPCGLDRRSLTAPLTHPAGDALLTDEPGVLLGIRTADCMPILLADPGRRAVAAVHAGWRGALDRIVEKTVGEMRRQFGSDPHRLAAVIGPSIRACCYEVGEEVVAAFCGGFVNGERFFRSATTRDADQEISRRYPLLFLSKQPPGHGPDPSAYLDLVAVARAQLEGAGVNPSRIYTADFCTACRTDFFFSYRKEGERTGRMMAVAGILSGKGGRA